MSGGVGPSSDISLPQEPHHHEPAGLKTKKPVGPVRRSFFTFRQLNVLAAAIVLSASGMVSLDDVSFVLFSFIYFFFLSKIAFPPTAASPHSEPPLFGEKNTVLLTVYTAIGAVVGLLLPVAYIFEGIFEGDKEGIKAAAPHVFLLACQVFTEGLASSGNFSLPMQVFVHVFYNSWRILTIMEWMTSEISKPEMEYGGNWRRVYVGRALAVGNMVFWSFNLLGILLPVFLPKAFRMYYSDDTISHQSKVD